MGLGQCTTLLYQPERLDNTGFVDKKTGKPSSGSVYLAPILMRP
jgi:hypothetical protein